MQGLRFKKAHVTHPELKATFCLPILGVKKNPSSPLYTSLGVITKGTVVEVNVSELGLVTQGGKVIWGKSVCPPPLHNYMSVLSSCVCERGRDLRTCGLHTRSGAVSSCGGVGGGHTLRELVLWLGEGRGWAFLSCKL